MANPWIGAHKSHTSRVEQALVDIEYADHQDAEAICPFCGAAAFYRATVGAVQCPNCRAVERPSDGRWVK